MSTKARYGSTRDDVVNFFLTTDKVAYDSADVADAIGANTKTTRNVLCMLVADEALRKTKTGYKARSARTLRTIAA